MLPLPRARPPGIPKSRHRAQRENFAHLDIDFITKIVQTWLVVTMDERESVNLCVVGQQFIIVFNLPLGISENQVRLARSSCLGKSLAIPECNVQVDVEFRCRCRMRARARPPQMCVTVTQKSVCLCLRGRAIDL